MEEAPTYGTDGHTVGLNSSGRADGRSPAASGSGQVRQACMADSWLSTVGWGVDSVGALDREVRYSGDPAVGGTDTNVLIGWPEALTDRQHRPDRTAGCLPDHTAGR